MTNIVFWYFNEKVDNKNVLNEPFISIMLIWKSNKDANNFIKNGTAAQWFIDAYSTKICNKFVESIIKHQST